MKIIMTKNEFKALYERERLKGDMLVEGDKNGRKTLEWCDFLNRTYAYRYEDSGEVINVYNYIKSAV